jgi:hypothetical protein
LIFALDGEEEAAYSLKTFGMNNQFDKNVVRLWLKVEARRPGGAPDLFAQIARAALISKFSAIRRRNGSKSASRFT